MSATPNPEPLRSWRVALEAHQLSREQMEVLEDIVAKVRLKVWWRRCGRCASSTGSCAAWSHGLAYKQTAVSYERPARFAGETKFPLRKMLRFAIDGITSFSSVLLPFATWLGVAVVALAPRRSESGRCL